MPRPPSTLVLILSFSPILVGSSADSLKFEKLLAFATDKSVRIEYALKPSSDVGAVDVSGAISRGQTGHLLWQGSLGRTLLKPDIATTATHTVSDLQPELWEPTAPALYQLRVTANKEGRVLAERTVRFGFRSMDIRNGQFHLNGRPIFLRGVAINPPGRGIAAAVGESRPFAEAYVRCLKSHNLNIFRLTGDESQTWFDVCDELGMMMYAGRYGSPPEADTGKRSAPKGFARSIAGYKTLFENCVNHPCIVLYYLANELPVQGQRGADFSALLTQAHKELKAWDPTRPYIGNAGYGEGREGDVCDVHRYWGWYYNSFLTYYHLRDKLVDRPLFGDPVKNQPLTFTECVGSFTGSSGEFNVVRSKQLGPRLGWIGHTDRPQEDALRYQSFMVKQATESFRRMRPLNPRLAGIMPFTILFYNWSGIDSFDQMKPKAALEQMALSYQPVLLSWELWTPQAYAGSKLRSFAHVINDADDGAPLTNATLTCHLIASDGKESCRANIDLPPIPYYDAWRKVIELDSPGNLKTGEYVLAGSITIGSRTVSTNCTDLFIAGADWPKQTRRPATPVALYDPSGKTAAAFKQTGLEFERISSFSSVPRRSAALVVGEQSIGKLTAEQKQCLRRFVHDGGRILCLRPDAKVFEADWLPQKITFLEDSASDTHYPPRTRPFAEQMNVNPERNDHPVFARLDRYRLRLWSDYTGWDQTQPGFPRLYPVTAGFKLDQPQALAQTAILANYDRGLEGIALCEMFDGSGSVILSGFDLVNRAGLDPVADRLLANLVAYVASREGHYAHPLIEQPIQWGNFPTEHGVVCGSLNGLLVNAEWLPSPLNPSATPLPPNTGSWNMNPGEQFVPCGRNPFGPFGYSTGSSLRDSDPASSVGSGVFWARIPPGKRAVVTKVKNPVSSAAQLSVSINEKTVTGPLSVAAGQSLQLRSPLAAGTTNVSVRYTGTKTLVLLETSFE